MSDRLSRQQEAFVAAITGTGPIPDGFDVHRVEAARKALLTKRCGELARQWPELARSLAADLRPLFHEWASARPTRGAVLDGHDFARAHWSRLDAAARLEVAGAETTHAFDTGVRRRRGLTLRRAGDRTLVGWRGRRLR